MAASERAAPARPRVRFAIAALVAALLLVGVVIGAAGAPGWQMDEGSLLVYPDLVSEGERPHRDFETLYGPGNVWALALVYSVTEPTIGAERVVGLLYRLAIIGAVYLLARRAGRGPALAAAAVAAALAFSLGLVAFAWLGAVAAVLAGLAVVARALARREPVRAGPWRMAGVLWAVAVLFRHDLTLGVAAAALVVVLRAPKAARRPLAQGLAVAVAGYLVHLVTAGPSALVRGMLRDPLRQSPGRRLPLPPRDAEEAALLALVALGVAVILAAGVVLRRRGRADEATVFLALGLLCAGMLPQALQRADAVHIVFVAVAAVPLAPIAAVRLLEVMPFEPAYRWTAFAGIVLAVVLVAVAAPLPGREVWHAAARGLGLEDDEFESVRRAGRTWIAANEQEAAFLRAVLRDVDRVSDPGDRLFVGPADLRRTNYNDTFLYALLPELEPSGRFLEMNPGTANREGSGLADAVARADVVVLTTAYDGWDEPNASDEPGSAAPMDALRGLCPQAAYGPWRVYLPCRRADVPVETA